MELEADCIVCRLRRYLFGVFFRVFTDHECLQQIRKIGETKPRIQRWMEFLSAYNFNLSYRRGKDKATSCPNCPFLQRKGTSSALAPYQTQMTLASTSSALAASYLPSVPYLALAWVGWLPRRLLLQAMTWVGLSPNRILLSRVGYV